MLPSSSRVSPITYHSVVAVRYPDLCRIINGRWELGSFASGGLPDRPPGYQFVLWDTDAKINGLVAADMDTLVSRMLTSFPTNAGFSEGLFVMTTATDHKIISTAPPLRSTTLAPCEWKPLLTRQEALLQ